MSRIRSQSGASLVEMLVVVLVMSFVSAAAFGLLTTTMSGQVKLQNKCDSLNSAKKSLERIGRVMRMGRTFAAGSNSTTMIVQVPKFDDNGYPYQVGGVEALETHTFQVLPDTDANNAGEFCLWWTKNSGLAVPPSADIAKVNINTNLGPQLMCSGIISPAGGAAFAYIRRADSQTVAAPVAPMSDYTGASITFEVLDHKNSVKINGNWKDPVVLAYKTEVFMRNNANMSNNQ